MAKPIRRTRTIGCLLLLLGGTAVGCGNDLSNNSGNDANKTDSGSKTDTEDTENGTDTEDTENGTDVDTTTDTEQPTGHSNPETLYRFPELEGAGGNIWNIVVDDRHVYFQIPGGIWRAEKDGFGFIDSLQNPVAPLW